MIDLLSSLRWQDLVDIALLTAIFYGFILLLQGSRTVQIAAGFFLVGVIYYLTDLLGLAGLNWLLTNLFSSIVVVIIVLFQADIRKALAQIGTQTFFRDFNPRKAVTLIDQLIKVCEHFAKTRTGALIVLEKDIGLKEYYTNATRLDAVFSPKLLATIFNTHGPLHDGAIVIDKSQHISHAGCILPLSNQEDLSGNLGTRHRAALGLSEVCDAVILVVSEERGVISIARGGELIPGGSDAELRKKIYELYMNKSQDSRPPEPKPEAKTEAKGEAAP
ncbi:MAG: TIGR00159 family protein [Candidatus Lambdaproteobacteria bacterium RIFOXYD1_FULL_56_27]|uniref:Diadenylate cyclase n=1 Tax=Candidatus Lambdaproteobacteria bacterium RIFOXYD2_FULL_56_26 TaxID=1817773 RepID=A0A1F6GVR5_9PROT|nr:MAG: TIGR00159 family protein [Candidatus Lambdaproteobacteria bacterium RIFOXYD2_FULL_56_26]OGH03283.1 MAG: TIGR00159 family protein [Candidatus Lambdaproteobacteria bacterium RIFOXYC1_FULL_56_13]OGH07481.1 MAG: TIGR00159 family protein [Candidatus Lambdaproteobacteria bacterium RIFOXYD1_FULL_56_27]